MRTDWVNNPRNRIIKIDAIKNFSFSWPETDFLQRHYSQLTNSEFSWNDADNLRQRLTKFTHKTKDVDENRYQEHAGFSHSPNHALFVFWSKISPDARSMYLSDSELQRLICNRYPHKCPQGQSKRILVPKLYVAYNTVASKIGISNKPRSRNDDNNMVHYGTIHTPYATEVERRVKRLLEGYRSSVPEFARKTEYFDRSHISEEFLWKISRVVAREYVSKELSFSQHELVCLPDEKLYTVKPPSIVSPSSIDEQLLSSIQDLFGLNHALAR